MTRFFYVDEFRNVTEVTADQLEEAGEIRLSGDQFNFSIGTGVSAFEVTVNDWFVGSVTSRVRAVAAAADAMWAEICG